MIRVFIGYDDNEKVAFSTLSHSLLKHSTQPLAITPIRLQNIKDIFVRERLPIQSTEFAFSRFIVPYLCNYSGHAIFMDCDMLARGDISKLWRQRTTKYAVQCVQQHQFKWLESEELIGHVDVEWNHLVGEYQYNHNAKLVHFTEGGPYFKDYKDCHYADEWFEAYEDTTKVNM